MPRCMAQSLSDARHVQPVGLLIFFRAHFRMKSTPGQDSDPQHHSPLLTYSAMGNRYMSALLDLELFAMSLWSISLGALGAAVTGIILANTDWFLSKAEKATLEYLKDTELKTLDDETESRSFKAEELWQRNGAVIMAVRRPGCFLCREEAAELSSLKPQLEQLNVPLYAVVKENIGTEVRDFKQHFKGDVYLDEKKRFYGPFRRKMFLSGFLRLSVWQNFLRAKKDGYSGNIEGEGFILGGVFVIGAGNQGILLEHREKEFGDKVNTTSVLEAAAKIQRPAFSPES